MGNKTWYLTDKGEKVVETLLKRFESPTNYQPTDQEEVLFEIKENKGRVSIGYLMDHFCYNYQTMYRLEKDGYLSRKSKSKK